MRSILLIEVLIRELDIGCKSDQPEYATHSGPIRKSSTNGNRMRSKRDLMTKVREYSYISTLRTKGPSIYYLEARHASDSLSTLPCRYDDPDLGCGSKIEYR